MKKDITKEIEDEVEKKKEPESVKKRKSIKKKDAIGRWSGLILFVLIFLISFLLRIGGGSFR